MSQYVGGPGSVTGLRAGVDEQKGFVDELTHETMAAGHSPAAICNYHLSKKTAINF